MKNILVMGGRRFVGSRLVKLLLEEGNEVTVANRSGKSDSSKDVRIVCFNRDDVDSINLKIAKREYDIVYDMICYSPQSAQYAVDCIEAGKYIMVSSSVVYDWGINHVESEFNSCDFSVINGMIEELGKRYGYKQGYKFGKMGAEAVIMNSRLPSALCVRFPLIIGNGDHTGRMETYVDAISNRKPIYVNNLFSEFSVVEAQNAAEYLFQIKDMMKKRGAVNICDYGTITMLQLINKILKISDRNEVNYSEKGIGGGTTTISAILYV